ncbi:MAG: hypothetical protein KIT31_12825 [Deltaproteobacteria bacterium]|nr:hypothetical protein [Deltaproteobacteria bacterium]
MTTTLRISLAAALALAACSDEQSGTITATAYGEDFIEQGIPADVFGDGWSVSFDAFLVSIGTPKAKAGEGGAEVGPDAMFVVDLARPSNGAGYELASFAAPGGFYDHYGYRIAPSATATNVNAAAGDFDDMTTEGFSIWVRGTATKGAETRAIDWGFKLDMAYAHCEMDRSVDGNTVEMQSTIHADHLFYDDATSPEPAVAFQLVADADGADGSTPDGTISLAELAATDIRGEARYQVGSQRDPQTGADIVNLAQYITLQATTVGHINGEGHCADVIVRR